MHSTVSLLSFVGGASAVVVDGKQCYQAFALSNFGWNNIDAMFDAATGDSDIAACSLGGSGNLTACRWASNAEMSSTFDSYRGLCELEAMCSVDDDLSLSPSSMQAMSIAFAATFACDSLNRFDGWTRGSAFLKGGTRYVWYD